MNERDLAKGFVTDYSLDDLHQMALNEFDSDPQATARLNAAYVESQSHYLFTLMTLRSEKADSR